MGGYGKGKDPPSYGRAPSAYSQGPSAYGKGPSAYVRDASSGHGAVYRSSPYITMTHRPAPPSKPPPGLYPQKIPPWQSRHTEEISAPAPVRYEPPAPSTRRKGTPKGMPPGAVGDPDEGRMVYVGGVPASAEWQELKDHMKQVGVVEFVQILTDPRGRSRGTGFVRYQNEAQANAAVDELNDTVMVGMAPGDSLQIDFWTGEKPPTAKGKGSAVTNSGAPISKGKGGKGKSKTKLAAMASPGYGAFDPTFKVRVEGLPEDAGWPDLKDHMGQAGTVEFCNVKRGVGEVRFSCAEMAQSAIEMLNGTELLGTLIVVEPWS